MCQLLRCYTGSGAAKLSQMLQQRWPSLNPIVYYLAAKRLKDYCTSAHSCFRRKKVKKYFWEFKLHQLFQKYSLSNVNLVSARMTVVDIISAILFIHDDNVSQLTLVCLNTGSFAIEVGDGACLSVVAGRQSGIGSREGKTQAKTTFSHKPQVKSRKI